MGIFFDAEERREKRARRRLIAVRSNELLDILEFAEGAIMDAILSEDGLDGDIGLNVLRMISDELVKAGRTSSFAQMSKEEV